MTDSSSGSRPLPDDEPQALLVRAGDRFPLGLAFGVLRPPGASSPPGLRPFATRYARVGPTDDLAVIDLSGVTYCPRRQVSVRDDVPLVAGEATYGATRQQASKVERLSGHNSTTMDSQNKPDPYSDWSTD